MTLEQLISDMEDAGTVDLRGDRVLPWILKVIARSRSRIPPGRRRSRSSGPGWPPAPTASTATRTGPTSTPQAIRIMDAWWPRLVEAQFKPTLGQALFNRIPFGHDAPGRVGPPSTAARTATCRRTSATCSARASGALFARLLRTGSVGACRSALLNSLSAALATRRTPSIYGGQTQAEHDKIGFSAVGAITQPLIPWVNRPTFQQAVEVQGHR